MVLSDGGLVLGLGLLALNFVTWRFTRFEQEWVRISVRGALFVGLSYALYLLSVNPIQLMPAGTSPLEHAMDVALALVWWFHAAQFAALLATRFALPPSWKQERLSQDVARAVVFLLAGLGAAACIFDLPVRALLATSGALAIVLGLAVQSTLSDVFSGIVLTATSPFRIGDLVKVGDIEGQVVQRNWRATTLLGAGGNYVVVPNSAAARANIVNFNQPAHIHGLMVPFRLSTAHNPSLVLKALRDATQSMASLGTNPAPTVAAMSVGSKVITYEISAYVASVTERTSAKSELVARAYQHLAAAGVIRTTLIEDTHREAMAIGLLASVDMFQTLNKTELATLADQVTWVQFDAGDVIYETTPDRADADSSLYIIASGVSILRSLVGDGREIRRLAPGEAIGRASILAGVTLNVSLKALTAVEAIRLDKAQLTPMLIARPEVGRQMLRSLAEYKNKASLHADGVALPGESSGGFMRRLLVGMRAFHGLGAPHRDSTNLLHVLGKNKT